MGDYTPPKVGDVQHGRRTYVEHLDGMREWSFTPTTDEDRDAFLAQALPLLIADCALLKDHDSWCLPHDSLWMPGDPHCGRFNDLDTFADSVIEAWEGRDRGR